MTDPDYGDTWAYEGIIGALPGLDVSTRLAVLVQFVGFQAAVLVLAAVYDRWTAVPAATVAVVVATVGSIEMVRIGRLVRRASVPDAYRRLLFGSSIEVVLAVLSFVALVSYLFAFAPVHAEAPLLDRLLGPDPPVAVVFLALLVCWDLCYRIGTGWWAGVVALWRSARYEFDGETAATLQRADVETMGFGLLQLALVPFLVDFPVLATAVLGHVLAVTFVTGTSILLLRRRTASETATPI